MARRYLFSILAVWVFIFAFETMVHGLGLASVYRDQAALFRSPEEGVDFVPILILGHLLLAAGIVGLVCGVAQAVSPASAAGIGAFLALTIGLGTSVLQFVAQPLPLYLVGIWGVAGIIEFAAAATLARLVFGDTSDV